MLAFALLFALVLVVVMYWRRSPSAPKVVAAEASTTTDELVTPTWNELNYDSEDEYKYDSEDIDGPGEKCDEVDDEFETAERNLHLLAQYFKLLSGGRMCYYLRTALHTVRVELGIAGWKGTGLDRHLMDTDRALNSIPLSFNSCPVLVDYNVHCDTDRIRPLVNVSA